MKELHARCGIYTRAETVRWFLDRIGWTADADLTDARLLEPSCGNGAFLAEAAARLCESFKAHSRRRTFKRLAPRLLAYELHAGEAAKARHRVATVLSEHRISTDTADRLVHEWIRSEDFLLAEIAQKRFSHVVGNPPYVRWSKIPKKLKKSYVQALPPHAARGDLCLAFLDRALGALDNDGKIAFLCSDRWLYAAYASEFRNSVLPDYVIESRQSATKEHVFENRVHAYPIKLIARRRKRRLHQRVRNLRGSGVIRAQREYEKWVTEFGTLDEAGYEIRVGPALGSEKIFAGEPAQLDVEPELLARYLGPKEITSDGISWLGRHVICMHDDEKKLRDLSQYAKATRYLKRHKRALTGRSIIQSGAPWYRPIDTVSALEWARPKLLIPEMTNNPRIIVDREGYIPSHGVYAIFSPDNDVDRLFNAISGNIFKVSILAISPRAKGGAFRCYKKFLKRLPAINQ